MICRSRCGSPRTNRGTLLAISRMRVSPFPSTTDGNIINWNPEAERLLGYSQAEAARINFGELRGDWDSWEMPDIFSSARQNGNWVQKITFRSRSGTEVDTEAMVISGNEQFTWVIRDIGWRIKAEKALREASDRFDALAQNTRSAFWTATSDGATILYESPAFKVISGLST